MPGKITIDLYLQGKHYEGLRSVASKSFQVALTVLSRLDETKGYEGTVEIIKISWNHASYGPEGPSEIDFRVVFNPLFWGRFHEKFEVVARWYIGSKTVSIYGLEESQSKELFYLSSLSLSNPTVNALADAVIEAMRTIIGNRQSFYEHAGEKLSQSERSLASSARKK